MTAALAARLRVSGLYAITPDESDTGSLACRVEQAIAGGASAVQYRNKAAAPELRREQALALLAKCRAASVPLIVNDDVSLAVAIGADGVHVGRDDAGVSEARARLGDHAIIGASCYDSLARAEAAVSQGADYIAFGSFHASSVKPDAVRPPLSLLTQARARFDAAVVAIGGITADNAQALMDAGAHAVAVISALFAAGNVEAAARALVAATRPPSSR
jgi:thiamine-phosphate pyrophosphorylase